MAPAARYELGRSLFEAEIGTGVVSLTIGAGVFEAKIGAEIVSLTTGA